MMFLKMFARSFVLCQALIVFVLWCSETEDERSLHNGSSCFQALTGCRYLRLYEQAGLAQLAKAISYEKAVTASTVMSRDFTRILVGMVVVEETHPDVPDLTLSLYDGELEPFEYVLTSITQCEDCKKTAAAEAPIKALESLLKAKKCVSDKLLNDWLFPLDESEKAAASQPVKDAKDKKGPTPQERLRKYFASTSFPPNGKQLLLAKFRRANYIKGLFEHWAVSAAVNVIVCAILAWPVIHVASQMEANRKIFCTIPAPSFIDLNGVHLCGAGIKPCQEICGTFITFATAIHDKMGISYMELALTLILLPVLTFNLSVRKAQYEHNVEELTYLRRLRENKKAVREVMAKKSGLEGVFQFQTVLSRFFQALRAWMGADDALAACGPITDEEFNLTAKVGWNDCFCQVMQPVNDTMNHLSAERGEDLLYGVGYAEGSDEDRDAIGNSWTLLKFRNDLGATDRNYKVLFDLEIKTKDSWDAFKTWCKESPAYKEQFKACVTTNGAQDSGSGAHLKVDSAICDILIPRGFCLTHVYVQTMPEDGSHYQIEVNGEGDGGVDLFWKDCEALVKSLCAPTDDEYEDNSFEARIQNFPIVARFALSEQYWQNMSTAEQIEVIQPETVVPKDFTGYVDCCLKAKPFEIKYEDGKEWLCYAAFSVFMGDEDPLNAMISAAKQVFSALLVYIQCLLLAFVVPALRFFSGGSLLPAPYSIALGLNIVSVWLQFSLFFSDFYQATTRLKLINDCLGLLESKTLQPSSRAVDAKAPAPAAGSDPAAAQPAAPAAPAAGAAAPAAPAAGAAPAANAARDAARSAKKAENATAPFDLFVMEDTRKVTKYDPADPFWKAEFQQKNDNVRNWHLTISYLRIFVSTSRLTAQCMLLAAAVIIAALLLMSIVQAMNGQGPVNSQMIDQMKAAAKSSIDTYAQGGASAARRLEAQILQTTTSLAHRRLAEVTSASALAATVPFSDVVANLRDALNPVRASLHSALWRQYETLMMARDSLMPKSHRILSQRRLEGNVITEDMAKYQALQDELKNVDVTKATKTQVFSMLMVILVMIYSIPLMWNIVVVNGYFDRHEDLLVKQMEAHRLQHDRRQAKGSGETNPDGTVNEAQPIAAEQPEVARYERMIKMTAESAKKTRERFPFKLFGFVISTQLLGSWIAVAGGSLVKQAKEAIPAAAGMACEKVIDSKWLDSFDDSQHTIRTMIKDDLCSMIEKMEVPDSMMPGGGEGKDDKLLRRLSEFSPVTRRLQGNELKTIVDSWWAAHPNQSAESKTVAVNMLLEELRVDSRRLLSVGPTAVARAFEREGVAGYWQALGTVTPYLEHQVMSEEERSEL